MTKKYFLVILLFSISLNSNLFAQEALKKGCYSLGGSIEFQSSINESQIGDIKSFDFNFQPSLTYFIADNLSTGLSIGYSYWETTIWNDKSISRTISFHPVVRYYFTGGKLIPFLEGGYIYSNDLSGNEDKNSFSFALGINYFLSKSVALEPYVEYQRSIYIDGDQKVDGFFIGIRINYFIVN
jgi:long-subunit fatty acid transport protein